MTIELRLFILRQPSMKRCRLKGVFEYNADEKYNMKEAYTKDFARTSFFSSEQSI